MVTQKNLLKAQNELKKKRMEIFILRRQQGAATFLVTQKNVLKAQNELEKPNVNIHSPVSAGGRSILDHKKDSVGASHPHRLDESP